MTRAIGHQTYKFGWCYAVGNLSSVNLGLVHRLITDWSNNESIRVFLEVMAAIIGLTVGLAATVVRPGVGMSSRSGHCSHQYGPAST